MELHPKYSPYPGGQAVTYNKIIELKSSNFQSTVLLNFIPEFENLEIFPPAASLIFKKFTKR